MALVISKETLGELEEKENIHSTYSLSVCSKEGTEVPAIAWLYTYVKGIKMPTVSSWK